MSVWRCRGRAEGADVIQLLEKLDPPEADDVYWRALGGRAHTPSIGRTLQAVHVCAHFNTLTYFVLQLLQLKKKKKKGNVPVSFHCPDHGDPDHSIPMRTNFLTVWGFNQHLLFNFNSEPQINGESRPRPHLHPPQIFSFLLQTPRRSGPRAGLYKKTFLSCTLIRLCLR